MVWASLLNPSLREREKWAVAVVRALLCEYFPPFHLDLPKCSLLPGFSSFVPGFLRVFRQGKPGVVTLLLSWELLGEHELLLHLPQVSVSAALRWPAKMRDMGFVLRVSGYCRVL